MTSDEVPDDDEIVECWCGARGKACELFDMDVFRKTCGGLGTLTCECGGDFCVCHHHGEVECPGCVDCRQDDFSDGDDGWYEEDYDDPDGFGDGIIEEEDDRE